MKAVEDAGLALLWTVVIGVVTGVVVDVVTGVVADVVIDVVIGPMTLTNFKNLCGPVSNVRHSR